MKLHARKSKTNSRAGLAIPALAFCAAAFVAKRILRPPLDLHNKVALITGGSRGLGFALARAFSKRGCPVALCARDERQLALASKALEKEGAQVVTIPCDVSDRDQVRKMVREVMETLGRIDILVNNAGVIQVGPARQMQVEDFEQAFSVNFWGTLYPILEALPHLTATGGGTIVNINSIGGKVSVPHLIPYSCAKFAAAALSEGLRVELASDGMHVLTVAPGLMRTGSFINAMFKGRMREEYTWFTASATAPLLSMSPARAARCIVRAVRQRRSEIVLSAPAKALVGFHDLCPETAQRLLSLAARALPASSEEDGPGRRGSEFVSEHEGVLGLVNRAGKQAIDRYQWGRELTRLP